MIRRTRPSQAESGEAIEAAPSGGSTPVRHDHQAVELSRERPEPAALSVLSDTLARRHRVIPMYLNGGYLVVAAADTTDADLVTMLSGLDVTEVIVRPVDSAELDRGLNTHYRLVSVDDEQIRQFWASATPTETVTTTTVVDAPIVQLVNRLVTQAHRDRVSDIHVEPTEGRMRIRFRVDGALREVLSLPLTVGPELVSRLKVMADMDIVERRRPQDGQFQMVVDGAGLDVRVATGATIWGETAVLRLLDKSRSLKALSDLGMPEFGQARFRNIIHRPYGMIVCSGPTGAGKTTTLYATLAEINRDELNVMTIEDPVEYVFPAANQMQINLQADITFASGLKSILRQDPDVILVGEIRDEETARIAVQAALTGHLVMSSIHATDAASALFRFIDMGIEPFLVASAVVGVVGQRLVRRVCRTCTTDYRPTDDEIRLFEQLGGAPGTTFVRGQGCEYCSGTGYRDRVAAYEILEVTEEIGQKLVSGATPHEIRHLASGQGMRPMRTEAMDMVAHGITTIDEVLRNVYIA